MRSLIGLMAFVGLTAGSIACSAMMDDLSASEGTTSPANDSTTKGEHIGTGAQTNMLESDAGSIIDDPDAAVPDLKLDQTADAGVPMAPSCQLVTLTPTAVQSVGEGQPWAQPLDGLADDGDNTVANLSTDKRDSAQLVFSGFTGPAIPANAVIKGLLVDIDRSSGGSCIQANGVSALLGGAVRPRPEATDPWQGIRFYGGIEDTWGVTIAPAHLGASFAVTVRTRLFGRQAQCPAREARVDTLRARVHYCVN